MKFQTQEKDVCRQNSAKLYMSILKLYKIV